MGAHCHLHGSLPAPGSSGSPGQGSWGQAGGYPSAFHKLKDPGAWEAMAGGLAVPRARHPKMASTAAPTAGTAQHPPFLTSIVFGHPQGAAGLSPQHSSTSSGAAFGIFGVCVRECVVQERGWEYVHRSERGQMQEWVHECTSAPRTSVHTHVHGWARAQDARVCRNVLWCSSEVCQKRTRDRGRSGA